MTTTKMMKTPTFNSLGPSHSRPAADIPKRETAIYEVDITVLTVLLVTVISRFSEAQNVLVSTAVTPSVSRN